MPVKAKFVTMAEEEALRKKRERKGEDGTPQWLLLTGMAAGGRLAGGLVIFALLPPSADTLYRQVAAAAESGELEKLQSVDAEIRQFLQRFPEDSRAVSWKSIANGSMWLAWRSNRNSRPASGAAVLCQCNGRISMPSA